MPRHFEEFVLEEVSLSPERTITEADVQSFAALTGDRNALHLDAEAARQSRFGQRVAHGAFVFAVSVGLLQSDEQRRPHVMAFLGVERLRFVRPVFLGDSIRVRQTVRSLDPVNEESGLMEAGEEVLNQDDAVTVSYTAKFLIRRSATLAERHR